MLSGLHGYWSDPAQLRKKLTELEPAQIRLMIPNGDVYQIGLGKWSVLTVGSENQIVVSHSWLAKMVIGLGTGKHRQERWKIEIEEDFSITLPYRHYYFQPARSPTHRNGSRPERVKVITVVRESCWLLHKDDPLIILNLSGHPVPRFMSSVM